MRAVDGYFVIKPEDLCWRPSNLMKIPNADFLERTKSDFRCPVVVSPAQERQYPPSTSQDGGILLCCRRRWADAHC
jgi:hypothetical protein